MYPPGDSAPLRTGEIRETRATPPLRAPPPCGPIVKYYAVSAAGLQPSSRIQFLDSSDGYLRLAGGFTLTAR